MELLGAFPSTLRPCPILLPGRLLWLYCPTPDVGKEKGWRETVVVKNGADINILDDVCILFSLLIYSLVPQLQLLFLWSHLVTELKKNILFVATGPQVRLASSNISSCYGCTCEFNKVCCLFKLCCCLLNCREVGSCHYARSFLIEV